MRKLIAVSLILVVAVGFALTEVKKSSMGNVSGSIIRGTAADTLSLGELCMGATFITFFFKADSVVDSLCNLVPRFEYRPGNTDAWLALTPVTGDAGDTWVLSGNTSNAINTLWTWDTLPLVGGKNYLTYDMFKTSRVILTGKRASQSAKNCTLVVNVRKTD